MKFELHTASGQLITYDGQGNVSFICANCHKSATEPHNEEEDIAKYERDTGDKFDRDQVVMVCEPCYKVLLEGLNEQ